MKGLPWNLTFANAVRQMGVRYNARLGPPVDEPDRFAAERLYRPVSNWRTQPNADLDRDTRFVSIAMSPVRLWRTLNSRFQRHCGHPRFR